MLRSLVGSEMCIRDRVAVGASLPASLRTEQKYIYKSERSIAARIALRNYYIKKSDLNDSQHDYKSSTQTDLEPVIGKPTRVIRLDKNTRITDHKLTTTSYEEIHIHTRGNVGPSWIPLLTFSKVRTLTCNMSNLSEESSDQFSEDDNATLIKWVKPYEISETSPLPAPDYALPTNPRAQTHIPLKTWLAASLARKLRFKFPRRIPTEPYNPDPRETASKPIPNPRMERIPRKDQLKQRRATNSEAIQKASHDPVMAKIMKDMSKIHGKYKLLYINKRKILTPLST